MIGRNIAITLIFSIAFGCNQDESRKLPSIDLLMKDSVTRINTLSIHNGKPMMIINFEADCKHCQDETDSLLKYVNDFPETKFCFINMISMKEVRTFSKHFKFDNYRNIFIGQDTGKVFPKHIGSRTTPFSVVYNSDGKGVKAFVGEAKMSDLIPILQTLNNKKL